MLVRKTVVREIGNNDADQTAENHHSTVHTAGSILEEKEDASRSHDVESVEEEEEEEIGTALLQSEASLPSSLPLSASISASVTGSNTANTPTPVPVNVIDEAGKEGKGAGVEAAGARGVGAGGGGAGKEGQNGVQMTSSEKMTTTTLVTMNMKGLAEEVDVRSAAVAQYCAMYVHT
jgi:hypothetical protein